VVETIDIVLEENVDKAKKDNEVIVTDVKLMEAIIPGQSESNASNLKKETETDDDENIHYEHPTIQKQDIVNSIKSKTDVSKIEENKEENENGVPIDNEIETYESSDIISSEKVKKKKDKKKKDSHKNKKENNSEGGKGKHKKKGDNGGQDKITKTNCNKPKYAAKNPKECKGLERIDNVLAQKCKKEKYKKKHKERCKDLETFVETDLDDSIKVRCQKPKYRAGHQTDCVDTDVFVLEDVRCKKDAFRRKYPELCTTGNYENDIETSSSTEDPDWLEDRCKHDKFRNRHKDLCHELCVIG